MNKFFTALLSGSFLFPFLWAEDLGRYQLILDKQLLGVQKAAPAPVKPAQVVEAAPSWSRQYRMTMITQDDDRVRVGLQNLQDRSAVLLIEGEPSHPDFQLISADFQQGTARIRYRGSESRFTIESGPEPVASVQKTPITPSPPTNPRHNRSSTSRRTITPQPASPGTLRSFPQNKESTPAPQIREFKTREELQAHLRQQQMDAIRTGKPPLPIPLTQKMDDQLVKEGVLPPQN